jgi:hypothetical protein
VQPAGIFAGQCVQRAGLARLPAGGDDPVAARQQRAGEGEAEAAIGAGDETTPWTHGQLLPLGTCGLV